MSPGDGSVGSATWGTRPAPSWTALLAIAGRLGRGLAREGTWRSSGFYLRAGEPPTWSAVDTQTYCVPFPETHQTSCCSAHDEPPEGVGEKMQTL